MDWLRILGVAALALGCLAAITLITGPTAALPALPGVIALAALAFQYTEKWRRPSFVLSGPQRPPGYADDVYTLRVVNHRLDELTVHFAGIETEHGDRVGFNLPDSPMWIGGWEKSVIAADDMLVLTLSAVAISHTAIVGSKHRSVPDEVIRLTPVVEYGAAKTIKGRARRFVVKACNCRQCRDVLRPEAL